MFTSILRWLAGLFRAFSRDPILHEPPIAPENTEAPAATPEGQPAANDDRRNRIMMLFGVPVEQVADLTAPHGWQDRRMMLVGGPALELHIRNAPAPIVLTPDKRIVLGRLAEDSRQAPDVDLTPYEGLEKGVSRLHAAILGSQGTFSIVDLGSTNGTHLNGHRLVANQPRILRDGDEIRLGRLMIYVLSQGSGSGSRRWRLI